MKWNGTALNTQQGGYAGITSLYYYYYYYFYFISRATDRFVCKLLQTCRPYLLHLNLRGCDSLTKPSYVAIGKSQTTNVRRELEW